MLNTIETKRCFLHTAKKADQQDIYKLYKNKDVRKFLGGTVDQKKFNERFDHLMEENIAINWIIRLKENGSFIGLIGIDKYHDSDDYEVSYQLLPKFWDQGLAFETVNAIINYATHKMNLSFLVSETQSANLSSTKLLEKLGMKPVKTLARFGEQQTLYAMNLGDTKIEP